jgi:hypothetical protein
MLSDGILSSLVTALVRGCFVKRTHQASNSLVQGSQITKVYFPLFTNLSVPQASLISSPPSVLR